MKTKNLEKKRDLKELGFTEITNLIVIKGGNGGDDSGGGEIEVEKKGKKNDHEK